MRKLIILSILCFLSVFAKGQVYQLMPQYGYDAKRMNFDSTISIPTFCGAPSLLSNKIKKAALAFDSCNNLFYFYNPKTLAWDTIRSGSSTATKLTTTVFNKSGALIPKGSVVYIDGAHSSLYPSIALAKSNNEATSAYTYGVVETDISNMSLGIVVQVGSVTNLNLPTNSYTDGQTLYLSPTVAGGYTTTKPLAPNHYVAIGTIIRAHPQFGTIQVAIRNGFQLDEMSDVQIPLVPNDSTFLVFSRVDSLWHSKTIIEAIGIKPYSKQSYTSGASVTMTGNWLIINPASLLSTLTINLPSSPIDGQEVTISFGGTMTTGVVLNILTLSPSPLQASTPSYIEAGEYIGYRWNSTVSKWYRIK